MWGCDYLCETAAYRIHSLSTDQSSYFTVAPSLRPTPYTCQSWHLAAVLQWLVFFGDSDTRDAPFVNQALAPRRTKKLCVIWPTYRKKRSTPIFYFKIFFLTFHKGFAVSLQVILSNPTAVFKRRGSQPGMQESDFLKQITTVEELEPKANNCTKVCMYFPCAAWSCRVSALRVWLPQSFSSPIGSCVAHPDREGESNQRAQVPPGHSEDRGVNWSSSWRRLARYCHFTPVQQPLVTSEGYLFQQSLSLWWYKLIWWYKMYVFVFICSACFLHN